MLLKSITFSPLCDAARLAACKFKCKLQQPDAGEVQRENQTPKFPLQSPTPHHRQRRSHGQLQQILTCSLLIRTEKKTCGWIELIQNEDSRPTATSTDDLVSLLHRGWRHELKASSNWMHWSILFSPSKLPHRSGKKKKRKERKWLNAVSEVQKLGFRCLNWNSVNCSRHCLGVAI